MSDLWHFVPAALRDPVALAMPFLLVLVVVEAVAARLLEGGADVGAGDGPAPRQVAR